MKIKASVPFKFSSKLFDFEISEASIFCEQQKTNSNLNENVVNGFTNFLSCLDLYLDIIDINSVEGSQIQIYGSVILENGSILRATNKFHGQPCFSNIAIVMNNDELFDYASDSGLCYAQVHIVL